ncbi:MAG TPA: peptidase M16 [Deltaproteobacteria bacterium]|nr:MAG: zinc protease [Deltaproteobacteria bacterium GWA2_55_82]OGQ62357.1 MAG: zinc protease [Deltaproteobacteria bacterium RIFCSPLOWO2_02_FULL_55_12]OIJ73267.1 MAG: zinc protease [Deltaproteobacteria bacterium GWC2_55_46]HBG45469.1 peptidase M16 [Deltaproteobacteria bacterium]HCY10300.1 peptidase M16 [Deltaproteobacteria bacterium]
MSLVQKTRLESGIAVITEEMPDVESSSIGIWVNTGSRFETREINGVSHFIEHLLFKGTDKRTALDISMEIESVGGVLNAFTGREYTCFFAKILNKDLPKAIDLLSDIFINSKFDRKEMDKERLVVLQEIKMVEDTPDDIIHDIFAERFWEGHPLGWSILGPSKTIKSMERASVLKYFKEQYAPHNVFITAAGGLSHRSVVKLLKPAIGAIKKGGSPSQLLTPVAEPGVKLIKKELEQVHMCMGVPVPPQSHPDKYKIYLMNTILGAGMSSRLFQEIREKRGLAYSVYTYVNLCKDAGSLIAYAGTSDDKFGEVSGLILKEFERLSKDMTAVELKNAKEQLKGGMLLGLETSDNRMMKLARDEIYFGRYVPVKEIVKEIDKVTLAEMKKAASEFLSPDRITMVAMGKVNNRRLPSPLKAMV